MTYPVDLRVDDYIDALPRGSRRSAATFATWFTPPIPR